MDSKITGQIYRLSFRKMKNDNNSSKNLFFFRNIKKCLLDNYIRKCIAIDQFQRCNGNDKLRRQSERQTGII